jgi:hypothetical protein
MTFFEWIISLFVWLSADPAAIAAEPPRAAAAVAAARASMTAEDPQPPQPAPTECVCGGTCVDGKWKPDGRIVQPCPCPGTCACKAR